MIDLEGGQGRAGNRLRFARGDGTEVVVRWKSGPTRRNLRPGLPAFRRACNYYTTVGPPPNRTEAVGDLIDLEEDKAARALVFGCSRRWIGNSVPRD
jgi:hypothetical protein